jgi:hypothetical protein
VYVRQGLQGAAAEAALEGVRWCERCGCTDWDACDLAIPNADGTGWVSLGPCGWVSPRLCTCCATLAELLASEEAGIPWLFTALGNWGIDQVVIEDGTKMLGEVVGVRPGLWRVGEA